MVAICEVQFHSGRAIFGRMAHPTFQIVPQPNHTFSVNLTTLGGRLKAIAGFDSEHEAAAWIVQTERTLHDANPRFRILSRDKGYN